MILQKQSGLIIKHEYVLGAEVQSFFCGQMGSKMSQGTAKGNSLIFGKDKAPATPKVREEMALLAVQGLDAAGWQTGHAKPCEK